MNNTNKSSVLALQISVLICASFKVSDVCTHTHKSHCRMCEVTYCKPTGCIFGSLWRNGDTYLIKCRCFVTRCEVFVTIGTIVPQLITISILSDQFSRIVRVSNLSQFSDSQEGGMSGSRGVMESGLHFFIIVSK